MRGRLMLMVMLLLPACDPLMVREVSAPNEAYAGESANHASAEGHGAAAGGHEGEHGDGEHSEAVIDVPESLTAAQANVDVFPKGSSPTRRSVVVGVIDVHTSAENPDKGFDVLRVVAAQLGADAVIGAEFEHGEGNEPSHLSGMAIRYIAGGAS